MEKTFFERLLQMKLELKVEKGVYNSFGKFNYRTKEQIYEALKPLEQKFGIYISTTHDIVEINGRLFVKAVAEAIDITSGVIERTTTSYAELQPKAGTQMNESQLTGSAESYAGKRALEAMFGLDNTKDADDEDLNVGDFNARKVETPTFIQQKQTTPNTSVETPKGDSKKNAFYELSQKSLMAKTLQDIKDLFIELEKLGGDDITEKVINTKAKQLGLVRNLQTNEWEEL